MATPRAGKSLGIGLLPPLNEHEEDFGEEDISTAHTPAGATCSAQTPVSTAHSLGAGSLDADGREVACATPSISNKSSARIGGKMRSRTGLPAKNAPPHDHDHDDSDAHSVQSAGSDRSAASAAASVSSARSLGVGSLLPLIEEEAVAAAAAAEGGGSVKELADEEAEAGNANQNQHTPTSSNKARHPICHVGNAGAEPLLRVDIGHRHSSSNDDLLALHHANDDAISVLSGHSASIPMQTVADEAFFPQRSSGLQPIRQGGDDSQQNDADETSTFVSGITFDDAGGESPLRRQSHQQSSQQWRQGEPHVVDNDHASQMSGKSKKKKKMKNPFKRKKKHSASGEQGEGDSVSVFSGFSRVSELASVVSGRSTKSRMSISTIGSTRSRVSSFTGKLRKRRIKKKQKDSVIEENAVNNSPSADPSTPARIAFNTRSAVSSLASSAVDSYPATPVRRGAPKKEFQHTPSKYGESAVNTTLPTVGLGDDGSSCGEVSTLGSIVSALSVGSTDISKTSERIKRKNRAYRLKKTGRKTKRDDDADSASDSSSVDFASVKSRFLPSEDSPGRGKIFWKKKSNRTSAAGGSSDIQSEGHLEMKLEDFFIPDGLADRAPSEEIMLRLGIASEIGLAALEELRNLPRREMVDGRSSAIPSACVCGVEIPDYDSYVLNSVERFRQRLVI